MGCEPKLIAHQKKKQILTAFFPSVLFNIFHFTPNQQQICSVFLRSYVGCSFLTSGDIFDDNTIAQLDVVYRFPVSVLDVPRVFILHSVHLHSVALCSYLCTWASVYICVCVRVCIVYEHARLNKLKISAHSNSIDVLYLLASVFVYILYYNHFFYRLFFRSYYMFRSSFFSFSDIVCLNEKYNLITYNFNLNVVHETWKAHSADISRKE